MSKLDNKHTKTSFSYHSSALRFIFEEILYLLLVRSLFLTLKVNMLLGWYQELNHVPFVTTCLTCLQYAPYMPACLTCLQVLNYYVPTCHKLHLAYVPTLPIFNMPTSLRAYICFYCVFVPTCAHFSLAYVPTTTHFYLL